MEEPTTERLHTVAMAAVRLLPDEYEVICQRPKNSERANDDPLYWQDFVSGVVVAGVPEIHVPCPDTPTSLFIYLHEIGHVVLGHLYINEERLTTIKEEVELMASLWAYTFMLAYGLEVPFISKVLAAALARAAAIRPALIDAGLLTR